MEDEEAVVVEEDEDVLRDRVVTVFVASEAADGDEMGFCSPSSSSLSLFCSKTRFLFWIRSLWEAYVLRCEDADENKTRGEDGGEYIEDETILAPVVVLDGSESRYEDAELDVNGFSCNRKQILSSSSCLLVLIPP